MPNLGRWTSVDPMLAKYPGWSPYSYTRCNPLTLIDPDGMADQLAPQSAEQNNEKFRERNGAPPNKKAAAKVVENKVGEIAGQIGDAATETAKTGLDALETVSSIAGPLCTVVGVVSANPALITAGTYFNRIAAGTSFIKTVVSPTKGNVANTIGQVATTAGARIGGSQLRSLVNQGRLSVAEARAVAVQATMLEVITETAFDATFKKESGWPVPNNVQ